MKIAEGELSHRIGCRVLCFVPGQQLGAPFEDVFADESAIFRIGIDKSRNITAIPGFYLRVQRGFDPGLGISRIQQNRQEKRQQHRTDTQRLHS